MTSMWTKHMFVIWSCIRIKNYGRSKTGLPLSIDRSKVVLYCNPFFRAQVVIYMAFVLSLFVPHLFSFQCPGKAVFRDCGIT